MSKNKKHREVYVICRLDPWEYWNGHEWIEGANLRMAARWTSLLSASRTLAHLARSNHADMALVRIKPTAPEVST